MRTFFREILVTLILAIVIFLLLQATVQSFVIYRSSMEPNFHEDQRILVSKIAYRFHEPERGDVIIFHAPPKPEEDYIKRIIALPGETIEVKKGIVYINDHQLSEPYIKDRAKFTLPQRRIPKGEYFVLGDNRNNSNDSRNGWTVPHQNIIGKVWVSIWPPPEWGLAADYSLPE